jgi:hypothetical protein
MEHETFANLNVTINTCNENARKVLLNRCSNNRKLKNFINKVFRENKDIEIYLWDDGWEWDIECHGGGESAEIAICNHDFRDDEHYEGDGWEMFNSPELFSNYFDSFNWEDITLDNGKILLLIDGDDHLAFQIVDNEKMEDGKVDFYGITW